MIFRFALPAARLAFRSVVLPAVMVAVAASAGASELVTLRNGYTLECESHELLPGETVRLHMISAAGADNTMDVRASAVASIEPAVPMHAVANPQSAAKDMQILSTLLDTSGRTHNVNVALLASVVAAESGGNPRAVSRAGARGLMQLMPGTAQDLGVRDSFDPAGNVNGGSAYLDSLLRRYHDNVALALAAYNAGPAAVDRYRGVPPFPETQRYVARVIREFNRRVASRPQAAAAAAVR